MIVKVQCVVVGSQTARQGVFGNESLRLRFVGLLTVEKRSTHASFRGSIETFVSDRVLGVIPQWLSEIATLVHLFTPDNWVHSYRDVPQIPH